VQTGPRWLGVGLPLSNAFSRVVQVLEDGYRRVIGDKFQDLASTQFALPV